MKTSLPFRLLLLAGLLTCASGVTAQSALPLAAGYWNVETNLTTRDYTIVRFYNAQDQLVYQERLDHLYLNLMKGMGLCCRTGAQLNQVLARVLADPQAARQSTSLLAQQSEQNCRVQRVYAAR